MRMCEDMAGCAMYLEINCLRHMWLCEQLVIIFGALFMCTAFFVCVCVRVRVRARANLTRKANFIFASSYISLYSITLKSSSTFPLTDEATHINPSLLCIRPAFIYCEQKSPKDSGITVQHWASWGRGAPLPDEEGGACSLHLPALTVPHFSTSQHVWGGKQRKGKGW